MRRTRHNVAEQIARVALERFELVVFGTNDLFEFFDARPQEWLKIHELRDANPIQAFEEHHDVAVRHANELVDFGGRADGVQIGRGRLFDARIMLRHDSQALFFSVQ